MSADRWRVTYLGPYAHLRRTTGHESKAAAYRVARAITDEPEAELRSPKSSHLVIRGDVAIARLESYRSGKSGPSRYRVESHTRRTVYGTPSQWRQWDALAKRLGVTFPAALASGMALLWEATSAPRTPQARASRAAAKRRQVRVTREQARVWDPAISRLGLEWQEAVEAALWMLRSKSEPSTCI